MAWFEVLHNPPMLIPSDESAEALLKKYDGRCVNLQISGHSERQHRMLFDYLKWIWKEYYREKYPDADDFRDWVSVSVGHVKSSTMSIPDGNGGMVEVVFRKPLSWSFAKCDQQLFDSLVNRVSDLFDRLNGVSIDIWRQNVTL